MRLLGLMKVNSNDILISQCPEQHNKCASVAEIKNMLLGEMQQASKKMFGLVWQISSGVDGLFAQAILSPP